MTQPTRPYDALYDNTFTVAGPRDHYRQQTLGGGFNIERAPIYNNFFSELPHYPPSTLRLKNGDRVPAFIDRNYHQQPRDTADLQQRSDALAVSGAQRPKYFRRPLLAAAEIHVKQAPLPPLPQYQDLNATAPAAMGGGPEPRSKTVGTQSDYRENEAQTAPWEPGYVLPEHPTAKQLALCRRHHTDGPEVLHLRDMAFADGLPAGLQEVTRIDKMRAKRAFEATLPPIDDAARLPLRQKMIEEWEAREWEEREQEILDIQERRLELLENALQVREEELDAEHLTRVEDRKKATLAARAGRFADVQATRIKTMRQLIENRKYVEKHRKLQKPTIVERYANFGSHTYAPLQREGRFPESKPMGQEIETEGYEPATLKGVLELESFLPSRLLNPKVAPPRRPDRLDYGQRKEAGIQRDLKAINDLLDVSKATAGRGHGDCWPAPLQEDSGGGLGTGSLKRASSSSLAKAGAGQQQQPPPSAGGPPSGGTMGPPGSAAGAAAGGGGGGATAVPAAATATPAVSGGGAVSSPPRRVVRAVERPATPELPVPPALSQPQTAALVLLQRLLRGRAAQNIMYEGRLRRQELIDELRLSERLSPDSTRLDGKLLRRPEERSAATLRMDSLLGSVVAEVCAAMAETDPDQREVLMMALEASRAHAVAAAFTATASELSSTAAGAAAAAATAAAVPRSSRSSLPTEPPPPPQSRPSFVAATINLAALGISKEQAEEAATRIQAAFHGHKARKEVAAMRARGAALRRIIADGDDGKVVKCQAAVRGYLGRKRVQQMRAAQAEPGSTMATEEEEEAVAAAEEEAAVLFDPSSYTPEQMQAAKRIQAVQRGRLARKRVAALRAERELGGVDGTVAEPSSGEKLAEAAAEAEAEAEAAAAAAQAEAALNSDYTVEQEVAVIKIQAAGRGYLARRRVAAMREEVAAGGGVAAAEGQRRPAVIGRRGDPEVYIAAAAASAAAAAEAAAAAVGRVDEGEGEVLWPQMGSVPGLASLRPAPPSAGAGSAAAAEGPSAAEAHAEAEASLGGGAFGSAENSAAEGLPEGEPSLAVDSSSGGGGRGKREEEPGPEVSGVVGEGTGDGQEAEEGEGPAEEAKAEEGAPDEGGEEEEEQPEDA